MQELLSFEVLKNVFKNRRIVKSMVEFYKDQLPYEYDSLEPYIDKETMQIHYEKHHQAYCDKLNAALTDFNDVPEELDEIIKGISFYSMGVRNNAGGVWNHNFFWKSMRAGVQISVDFKNAIERDFGSYDQFIEQFSAKAVAQFGSGWAWLCKDSEGKLFVTSTPNQDNPLMDVVEQKGTPLLGLDVWEHAYYLNYQNRRPEYISNFFNIVNWEEVERRYKE